MPIDRNANGARFSSRRGAAVASGRFVTLRKTLEILGFYRDGLARLQ
jgi:hypothetical protein